MAAIQYKAIIVVTVLLAGALAWTFGRPEISNPPPTEAADGPWIRWRAMSRNERSAFLEQYRAIQRGDDGDDVLGRARAFAAMPAARRAYLRDLHRVVLDLLYSLPPSERRWLESLPAAARALELHRRLKAKGLLPEVPAPTTGG